MKLYIGNKNYSSWSLRPWLLLRQLGIPFDEVKLRLDTTETSAFKRTLRALGGPGRVPLLVLDDGFVVWDTLAITETVAERFPQAGVWPADPLQRARARSLCAEMHSGFTELRTHCPMNIEADFPELGARLWDEQPGLRQDMARLEQVWGECLAASGGPMLFGGFCAADAFFAPVCARLKAFALPMSGLARGYVERVGALPAMQEWVKEALEEHDFVPEDEPYRAAPEGTPAR
jgi:glutathione S-transferase